MRILHINDLYGTAGGVEKYVNAVLQELQRRGHWGGIIYGRGERDLPSADIAERFPVDFTQSLPEIVTDMVKIVERLRPDVVQVHDLGEADRIFGYLEPLCQLVPLVFYLHNHSLYCPGGMKYYPRTQEICRIASGTACLWHTFYHSCNSWRPATIWRTMARCAHAKSNAALADRILVASSYVKACAVQNGFPEQSITILPYFTDLPVVEKYPDGNQILFTGRIIRTKGLDLLLQALSYVREKFTLIVDGDGPDMARAQGLCRRLGLEDQVRFVGWCEPDAHAENYRRASLVVVPSAWPEPFGLVGIEAMSYAKPVVVFDVGGIRDWCEDGMTGLLVEPGDIRGLAERIELVLRDKDLAARLGKNGRIAVEHRFSTEKHIDTLLGLYGGLISEAPRSEDLSRSMFLGASLESGRLM